MLPATAQKKRSYRHRDWSEAEIAALVSLQLLDFFPRGQRQLLQRLRSRVPDRSRYLGFLTSREPMDYFRHWICPRVPAWWPFEWKWNLHEDASRMDDPRLGVGWEPAGSTLLGIEATAAIPEFGPRPPTMSPEEGIRKAAALARYRFVPKPRQGDEDVPGAPYLYINAPTAGKRQLVGEIFGHLCRMSLWLGVPMDPELTRVLGTQALPVLEKVKESRSKDFLVIEKAYTTRLGLPRTFFDQVLYAYWDARIMATVDKREPFGNPVFWAARLLALLDPEEYERCLRHARGFRRRVLPAVLRQSGKGASPKKLESIVAEFRADLERDPLLNCVFHGDVFSGHRHLELRSRHPGPAADRARRQTVFVAVTEFHQRFPRGAPASVGVILKDGRELSSRALRNLVEFETSRSAACFVAPMVSVTFQPMHVMTADAIKTAYIQAKREMRCLRFHPPAPSSPHSGATPSGPK